MAKRTAYVVLLPSPSVARWLGLAGLVPQVTLALVLFAGPPHLASAVVRLALCYAALILSFIGGVWWGLVAHPAKRAGVWLWLAAVAPSLIAFACLGAANLGGAPAPILSVIATALVATLAIDAWLAANGWCAPRWMRLRVTLSLGLAGLSLLIAASAP